MISRYRYRQSARRLEDTIGEELQAQLLLQLWRRCKARRMRELTPWFSLVSGWLRLLVLLLRERWAPAELTLRGATPMTLAVFC